MTSLQAEKVKISVVCVSGSSVSRRMSDVFKSVSDWFSKHNAKPGSHSPQRAGQADGPLLGRLVDGDLWPHRPTEASSRPKACNEVRQTTIKRHTAELTF